MKGMKAFVVTIDALVAMFLTFMFYSTIMLTLQTPQTISDVKAQRIGMDLLAAVESTGTLFNPTQVLAQVPASFCARIEIYNGTYSPTAIVGQFTKSGCTAGETEYTVWGTDSRWPYFYILRGAVWQLPG